jgi:hypothetical protein
VQCGAKADMNIVSPIIHPLSTHYLPHSLIAS